MDKAYNTHREGEDVQVIQSPVQASRARRSIILLLVAYVSRTAHHFDIRLVAGRELSTFQGYLAIASAVIFGFRPDPLQKMAASSYLRYGMS